VVHADGDSGDWDVLRAEFRDERRVRPLDGGAREVSFGGTGLVGDDRERVARVDERA
jgi:hypothetical protein